MKKVVLNNGIYFDVEDYVNYGTWARVSFTVEDAETLGALFDLISPESMEKVTIMEDGKAVETLINCTMAGADYERTDSCIVSNFEIEFESVE